MSRNSSKLGYVDLARGCAILLVILVHTSQSVPRLSVTAGALANYAQVGVQLFFVASAYTLCLSHVRRKRDKNALTSFYIRRYFRIAPLYYVGIVVYMILGFARQAAVGGGLATATYTPTNILANVLLVHGFVPSANNLVVPGGWSIGTEIAFYAIFPLLFKFVDRSGDDVGVDEGASRRTWVLLALAVGVSIAFNFSYRLEIGDWPVENGFLYYNIVNQGPVFVIGMIYFRYVTDLEYGGRMAPRALCTLLFVALAAVGVVVWNSRGPLAPMVTPLVSASSFFFLMEIFRQLPIRTSIVHRIGRVSYSMYVFHFLFAWPLVKLIVKLCRRVPGDLVLVGAVPLVVACSYGVAILSERLIEVRGIAMGTRLIKRMDRAAGVSAMSGPHTEV